MRGARITHCTWLYEVRSAQAVVGFVIPLDRATRDACAGWADEACQKLYCNRDLSIARIEGANYKDS